VFDFPLGFKQHRVLFKGLGLKVGLKLFEVG
jgi:hypothetical protein